MIKIVSQLKANYLFLYILNNVLPIIHILFTFISKLIVLCIFFPSNKILVLENMKEIKKKINIKIEHIKGEKE